MTAKPKKKLLNNLKVLEKEELIEIIIELIKLNPKNKQYVEVFMGCSDDIDFDIIVDKAKAKINRYVRGNGSPYGKIPFNLVEARKVIKEQSKLFEHYTFDLADLKLYFFEICHDIFKKYGDINGKIIHQTIGLFTEFIECIKKNQYLYPKFENRIQRVFDNSNKLVSMYIEPLNNIYDELMNRIGNKKNEYK